MDDKSQTTDIYKTSEDLISKEIEGQTMIVPLISGVGNLNEEMFQLNSTGSAVWEKLDGKTPLKDIIAALSEEYDIPLDIIQTDVLGLVETLTKKAFVVKVN